jgi:prepilin-type N-terminal cleavage/methylation domain-containing protein
MATTKNLAITSSLNEYGHMKKHGFTLIELSIVIVIIGLLAGGVLLGKDLIHAAEMRALLSQKDKFTSAVNVFEEKYDALPGDMSPTVSAKYGFFTFTGSHAGQGGYGNNNGLIISTLEQECVGECGAFWRHLSDAGLIPATGATLNADTDNDVPGFPAGVWDNYKQSLYMPNAKFGGTYWGAANLEDSGWYGHGNIPNMDTYKNVFFLALPGERLADYPTYLPNMSALDAYGLDLKIDDGKPQKGKFMVSSSDMHNGGIYHSYGAVDWLGVTLNESSTVCTIGANAYDGTATYNSNITTGGNNLSCKPIFVWDH